MRWQDLTGARVDVERVAYVTRSARLAYQLGDLPVGRHRAAGHLLDHPVYALEEPLGCIRFHAFAPFRLIDRRQKCTRRESAPHARRDGRGACGVLGSQVEGRRCVEVGAALHFSAARLPKSVPVPHVEGGVGLRAPDLLGDTAHERDLGLLVLGELVADLAASNPHCGEGRVRLERDVTCRPRGCARDHGVAVLKLRALGGHQAEDDLLCPAPRARELSKPPERSSSNSGRRRRRSRANKMGAHQVVPGRSMRGRVVVAAARA